MMMFYLGFRTFYGYLVFFENVHRLTATGRIINAYLYIKKWWVIRGLRVEKPRIWDV